MPTSRKQKVLISGASIAGPALAYWLHRYGFEVTVVEKSATVRGGGYPIDIRGTAVEVVRRMGLHPQLAAANIDSRTLSFLDGDGELIAALRPESITGGVAGRDIELPRGDLTSVLYAAVRDDVEFLFNDSIATLNDHDGGVDVTFASGRAGVFDLVIGSDGLHSNTRRLVFGPEEQFHRYLGFCFAGFTMPNELGLSHEGVTCNLPGKAAILYAAGDRDEVHAFLNFAWPDPPFAAFTDPAAQRDLVESVFAGGGWQIPNMLQAMRTAEDLFFDVVSQIHLPRWSSGRVALVGDAAYAPSFMSGQGSSIALVGAYVLAGELAARSDHTAAFAAYESGTREFVERNQAIATDGERSLSPRTDEELARRDEALRAAARSGGTAQSGEAVLTAATALTLPEYALVS